MADLALAQKRQADHPPERGAARPRGRMRGSPRQRGLVDLQDRMNESPATRRLEHLREGMNASPAVAANAALQRRLNPAGPVVQRSVKPLTEERLVALEESNDGDIDPAYLDGLYEAAGNPGHFLVYVGTQSRAVVKRAFDPDYELEISDASAKVHLYAPVEDVSEGRLDELLDGPDALPLITEDERATTLGAIRAADAALISPEHAATLPDQIISKALSGEPKQGAGGEFGALAFRFKSPKDGYVYTVEDDLATQFKAHGYNHVAKLSPGVFDGLRDAYSEEFPFAAERRDERFIYVETETDTKRLLALAQFALTGMVYPDSPAARKTAFDDSLHKPEIDDPPIPAPADSTKHQARDYTRIAVRGDRATGQKAAMGDVSARDYVAHFIGAHANAVKWEWLHLRGSRLGGRNEPGNLVAGTDSANTAMIPWEREVLELTRQAGVAQPVRVTWTASLQMAGGQRTHVGRLITMAVAAPNGLGDNPATSFTKTFNATEGAPYTSLDGERAKIAAKEQSGRQ